MYTFANDVGHCSSNDLGSGLENQKTHYPSPPPQFTKQSFMHKIRVYPQTLIPMFKSCAHNLNLWDGAQAPLDNYTGMPHTNMALPTCICTLPKQLIAAQYRPMYIWVHHHNACAPQPWLWACQNTNEFHNCTTDSTAASLSIWWACWCCCGVGGVCCWMYCCYLGLVGCKCCGVC